MTAPSGLDLERELARRRDEAEQARFSQFDPAMLSALALLPEWTDDLARSVQLGGTAEPAELVDRLHAAGIVERRESLSADGRRRQAFWLRSGTRPGVVRHVRAVRAGSVEADVAKLADAVGRLQPEDPGLRAWLDVVQRDRLDPTGRALMSRVDILVQEGRLGDAAGLVATARVVGEVTGGTLADAARRAQWRVDRAHRTNEDTHHLRHYFRRQLIEQAFDDLLDTRTEQWALHLLGAGGVGKTMLVRYLASGRYAADRGRSQFPVARADFDHLDPRYPLRRPAELLLVLADELAGFAGTRGSYSSYRRFRDAADALHEQLARADAGPSGHESLLDLAVTGFARFLAELPSPVVLVLDTCEELAKLYALGSSAPAIDRTFQLLELLRARRPDVRIVLAGRRWLVPAPGDPRRSAGPLLRARPYLRVLEIGGFSRAEAEAYLDARDRARTEATGTDTTGTDTTGTDTTGTDTTGTETTAGSGRLPPALRSALLDRSVQRRDGEASYNPFELASYCEWAFSEPDLDPDELRSAPGDPYVERRIIGRLGDGPARAGLGVAAAFGRFDRELAAPGWVRAGVDPQAAFDALAAQEWMTVLAVGSDGRPKVVEIDEHLRSRIRAVTKHSRELFPVDRRRLGRDAAGVIDRTPLGELPAETVEAAVHLLPADEAGPLWQRIEDRIVAEGEWAWADQVTLRVAAIELDRAARSDRPTILAAILATQAAAAVHTGLGRDVVELWRDVQRAVDGYPDGSARDVLRARAELGQAAGRYAAGEVDVPIVDIYLDVPEAPVGSIAAVVEGFLIGGPSTWDFGDWDMQPSIRPEMRVSLPTRMGELRRARPLAEIADATVAAVVSLTKSAILLWNGLLADAAGEADAAARAAERASGGPVRRWADWVPPRGLLDRCRLARLLVAVQANEPRDALPWPAWRSDAMARLPDVDAEWLVALTVQVELGRGPVDRPVLEAVERADRYVPGRRATSWLHRQVPSLTVALAEAWCALGELDRALDLLLRRREEAVAAGDDPDTIDECELALLRLCRRQRTTEYLPSVHRLAREGSVAARAEAWLVLTLVRGERPASPEQAGSWHGWWQCQDRRSLAAGPRLTPPSSDEPGVPAATSELDAREYERFFLPDVLPPEPEAGASIRLNDLAELADAIRAGRTVEAAPGALGRAGLAAGEVLALRFPTAAARLLASAAERLVDAGDTPGAIQAYLLAALAAARARQRSDAERSWQAVEPLLAGGAHSAGWSLRIEAVRTYLQRRKTPVFADASPELDFAPAPPSLPHPVETPGSVCGQCGRNNDPAAKFCTNCGAFLDWAGERAEPAQVAFGAPVQRSHPDQAVLRRPAGEPPPPPSPEPPEPPPPASLPASPPASLPASLPARRAPTWWPVVLGLLAAAIAGVLLAVVVTDRPAGSPPPLPTPTGTPISTASPPPTSQPTTSRPAPSATTSRPAPAATEPEVTGRPSTQPPATSGPERGVALALVVVSAAGVVLLLGLLAMVAGTWRHGYRFRAARGITVRRTAEGGPVRLVAGFHRGLADLDGGRLAAVGGWLRGNRRGRSARWLDWVAEVTPADGPVRIDVGRLQLPTRGGRRSLTIVQLDVDPRVEVHPWERCLASSGRPLTAFRWESGPPHPPPPAEPPDAAMATFRGPPHLAPDRSVRHSVLYLVGTPVTTAAGWRLRVTDATSRVGPSTGRHQLEGEELLGLEDRALADRVLVVLQAEPVDTPPQSLAEQRAGFVGLARAALDGRAAAVLVVPPLPDALAAEVIDTILSRVAAPRRRPVPSTIVALLARLTALIDEHGSAGADLLLFLRTRPGERKP
jgi:hypothetical protein